MSALLKIESAGFNLSLKGNGNILITPFSKLTDEQRQFIRSHKAEILDELKADSEPKYKRFVVTRDGIANNVISPTGLTLSEMRNKFSKAEVDVLH